MTEHAGGRRGLVALALVPLAAGVLGGTVTWAQAHDPAAESTGTTAAAPAAPVSAPVSSPVTEPVAVPATGSAAAPAPETVLPEAAGSSGEGLGNGSGPTLDELAAQVAAAQTRVAELRATLEQRAADAAAQAAAGTGGAASAGSVGAPAAASAPAAAPAAPAPAPAPAAPAAAPVPAPPPPVDTTTRASG